jgi:DNA invertase Pin-like site-specific DNA recombinase
MPAFGYVRKSVMTDEKTLSPQVQEERVRALAASKGDHDIIILNQDLDVSGSKVEEREDYMRLVAAIESGEATAVYAFDLSRLHRNTQEALRFFALAEEHHVPVTLVEGNIDTRGPTGTLVLTVLAAMNAWTSQITSVKIKATMAMKRANGEPLGGRRYGEVRTIELKDGTTRTVGADDNPQAVVEAYRSTRSFFRAARILSDAKVPTRNGRAKGWSPSAVRAVVARLEPDLIIETRVEDRPVQGGRVTTRPSRFGRVLRCSVCDAHLTPSVDPRTGATRYFCHAYIAAGHGRKTVMETAIIRAVLPAIEQTAIAMKRLTKAPDGGEVIDAEALAAKRTRTIEAYLEGLVPKARRDEILADIESQLSRAASARRVRRYTLPPDPKADAPERVNAWMRDTFERIIVDMETPGRRGISTDIAVRPEWRNGLRGEVEDIAAQG